MSHGRSRPIPLAVAAVILATSAGCGVMGGTGAGNDPAPGAGAAVSTTPAGDGVPSASSGLGDSVKDSGDLPDPCGSSLDTAEKTVSRLLPQI